MKVGELRTMTDEELLAREKDLRQEHLNQRFGVQAGQLEDTNVLRATKREIARIRTILRERKLGLGHNAQAQQEVAQ